jgi:hypothetical protein
MKTDDALSNTLGIEYSPTKQEILPPEPKTEAKVPEVISAGTTDAEADYNLARNTFRNLISQGNLAMEDMKELARQSESPRAYEVFATMMKTISETTKDLYDLQKKTKELKEDKSKPPSDSINIDRAVFVGTTSDLLKKIKEEKN